MLYEDIRNLIILLAAELISEMWISLNTPTEVQEDKLPLKTMYYSLNW